MFATQWVIVALAAVAAADPPGTQTILLVKGGYGVGANFLARSSRIVNASSFSRDVTKGFSSNALLAATKTASKLTRELQEAVHAAVASEDAQHSEQSQVTKLSKEVKVEEQSVEELTQVKITNAELVSQLSRATKEKDDAKAKISDLGKLVEEEKKTHAKKDAALKASKQNTDALDKWVQEDKQDELSKDAKLKVSEAKVKALDRWVQEEKKADVDKDAKLKAATDKVASLEKTLDAEKKDKELILWAAEEKEEEANQSEQKEGSEKSSAPSAPKKKAAASSVVAVAKAHMPATKELKEEKIFAEDEADVKSAGEAEETAEKDGGEENDSEADEVVADTALAEDKDVNEAAEAAKEEEDSEDKDGSVDQHVSDEEIDSGKEAQDDASSDAGSF